MSREPKLAVACLLTRWYNLSLEATLQASGFDDDNVAFVNGNNDATSDIVVSGALGPDDQSWAAQHVQMWRKCAASNDPILIFQEDVVFSSDNVHLATKALAREVGDVPELIIFLGATEPDREPSSAVSSIASACRLPACFASSTAAYVLWPTAARALLNSLPLDVPVPAFLGRHVAARKVAALMAVPALVVSEESLASPEIST